MSCIVSISECSCEPPISGGQLERLPHGVSRPTQSQCGDARCELVLLLTSLVSLGMGQQYGQKRVGRANGPPPNIFSGVYRNEHSSITQIDGNQISFHTFGEKIKAPL